MLKCLSFYQGFKECICYCRLTDIILESGHSLVIEKAISQQYNILYRGKKYLVALKAEGK